MVKKNWISIGWKILKKEWKVHIRSIQSITSMILLGFCILFLFHYSFEKQKPLELQNLIGIKWALLFLLSHTVIGQSVWEEKEMGAGAILSSLVSPSLIFIIKSISVWILLLSSMVFLLMGMVIFFQNMKWLDVANQFIILPWTSLALSFLGVSLSYMTISTRWKEIVLPLVFIPFSIPLFLFGLNAEFQYLEFPEKIKNSIVLMFFFCVFYGGVGALFQELQPEEMDSE